MMNRRPKLPASIFWKIKEESLAVVTPNPFHCDALGAAGVSDFAGSAEGSVTTSCWSALDGPTLEIFPDGQCTTTDSTCVADPNPKWSRGSLADSKLLLARTSEYCVSPPAVTSTRAPYPSRLEVEPTILIRIQ